MGALEGKTVVLGVTGGIAAYKAVELLRLMKKESAAVRVIMTANACRFVGPLTFEALAGCPVCTTLFEPGANAVVGHIQWARTADAVVVAPATANFLAKAANGIADDALSTFICAVDSPTLLCPSMNTHMYQSAAVQRNIDRLQKDGCTLLTPGAGALACGTSGPGRLPEPHHILDRTIKALTPTDLADKRILVTAGPTHEYLDPVRFITNPSSGKMGFAVAGAAEHRGAQVVLICGETHLEPPLNVTVVPVGSAQDMAEAVSCHADDVDAVVKAAAVSDYRPRERAAQKLKKTADELTITLSKTKDILKDLGRRTERPFLVGFAAESQALETHARNKLREKNLDIIVANLIVNRDAGFKADTNRVSLFYRDGSSESLPLMSKTALAHVLLDRMRERM